MLLFKDVQFKWLSITLQQQVEMLQWLWYLLKTLDSSFIIDFSASAGHYCCKHIEKGFGVLCYTQHRIDIKMVKQFLENINGFYPKENTSDVTYWTKISFTKNDYHKE